ncbi:MAG: hypothetical protein Q6L68_03455 [Thermostichus sp. DG02_5_bins_236]
MLGTLQSSTIRVEVEAASSTLRRCLTEVDLLRQWIWPQQLQGSLPEGLEIGSTFNAQWGPISIMHQVETLLPERLRLLMWGGADGYCDWLWGNGWVQLRVEAVSLLPLGMGQLLILRQLQQFAQKQEHARK